MTLRSSSIEDLPNALRGDEVARRIGDARPAVFLDYDGTLTPIVDRPQDAVLSERMREAVSALATRCTVCVVSGRDRPVVQELMGVSDLVVAGSHGFDIWSPEEGTIEHKAASGFEDLLAGVTARLEEELGSIDGAAVEPKRASVAAHYRLVAEPQRPKGGKGGRAAPGRASLQHLALLRGTQDLEFLRDYGAEIARGR